jgi:hypothetical protein
MKVANVCVLSKWHVFYPPIVTLPQARGVGYQPNALGRFLQLLQNFGARPKFILL